MLLSLLVTIGASATEATSSPPPGSPSQLPILATPDGTRFPPIPTDAATNAALDAYFAAQHISEMMDRSLILMVDATIRRNPATAPAREQLLAYFHKYAGWTVIEPFYRAEYAHAFTIDELHALTTFANTDLGRKVINEVPAITSQAMIFAQIVLDGHKDELRAIISQAMSIGSPRAPAP